MSTLTRPREGAQGVELPTHAGRWLAFTESMTYEADVREVVPGVFEALVHGYCIEFHPVCILVGHFTSWTPLSPESARHS